LKKEDLENAKSLFLKFSSSEILEINTHGYIIKKGDVGKIYIRGVLVNEEEKFGFSYNIISLNSEIKKALNRERKNIGRSAYQPKVMSMLKSATSTVRNLLASMKEKENINERVDELNWKEIHNLACECLTERQKKKKKKNKKRETKEKEIKNRKKNNWT